MTISDVRFGSVCSGIEAASVAWHPLGWKAAWLSEIEQFPAAVLAHYYPSVKNLGDMRKIAAKVLTGEVEAPDVLVGGTPCQAFSVAGLRDGLDDQRGQLTIKYMELANAIDFIRRRRGEEPVVIVWENVPGVLSDKTNAFGCFLAGLSGESTELQPAGGKWSNAGCVFGPQRTVAWRVLDAQYFGVAQRRRRVFVVASARKGFDPAAVLFEFDGVRRDIAPSREAGEGVAGTIAKCSFSGGAGGRPEGAAAGHFIASTEQPQPLAACLDASFGRLRGCSNQDANHGHSHLVPMAYGGNNTTGPIDVATARNACGSGSGSGRMDFETETFLVQCVTGDITHTLKAEGFDASEDGTGRGQPIVTHCRDVAQTITGNYGKQVDNSDTALGPNVVCVHGTQDPCIDEHLDFALGRNSGQENAIAFSCKDHGADAGPISPTLRSMGHDGSHANGGGQVAVSYSTKLHNTSSNQAGKLYREYTVGLDVNSPPPALVTAMQVRRLTPIECERLQGFTDNYTRIPNWNGWRKLDAGETIEQCIAEGLEVRQNKKTGKWRVKDVDGPRYKALGNSMAVPVMAFIGKRVAAEMTITRCAA